MRWGFFFFFFSLVGVWEIGGVVLRNLCLDNFDW